MASWVSSLVIAFFHSSREEIWAEYIFDKAWINYSD